MKSKLRIIIVSPNVNDYDTGEDSEKTAYYTKRVNEMNVNDPNIFLKRCR
jgi:hypothetical protein